MSAFLGPIHFWLYNKIGKQEELTDSVAALAERSGWITDRSHYTKKLPPLEEVIDESNIHGWLQAQIHDAEERYAELIQDILEGGADRLNAVLDTAFDFGKANGINSDAGVSETYRSFENFFLNGMPCDRVNSVIFENENEVAWEMTQDIHAMYWNNDTSVYYAIRKMVMTGMLDGTAIRVDSADGIHYSLSTVQ